METFVDFQEVINEESMTDLQNELSLSRVYFLRLKGVEIQSRKTTLTWLRMNQFGLQLLGLKITKELYYSAKRRSI